MKDGFKQVVKVFNRRYDEYGCSLSMDGMAKEIQDFAEQNAYDIGTISIAPDNLSAMVVFKKN